MKVLIVDDEFYAVQGVLDGVNWDLLGFEEVLTANSYAEAVEIMSAKNVEILVTDIEMPDESGLELVSWTGENRPNTECIILSCHDDFSFAKQALQMHCLDYVLKPVRYDALTEVLAKAMETVQNKTRKDVMENYGQQYIDQLAQKSRGGQKDPVDLVTEYIADHLAEDLSVKTLANQVYISPDHLTRSFKKRYGKTVSDYILEKRMLLAGELLRKNLTITMVSDSVGFGNYSYFTEQFKRFYGMTPREYQKKHRI